MIVTLRLPDEIVEKYQSYNPASPQKAMEAQLVRFSNYRADDRGMIFSQSDRQALEASFGRPFEGPADVLKAVQQLLTAKVEGVDIALSEGQRKRLTQQATFYKKSTAEWTEQMIRKALNAGL